MFTCFKILYAFCMTLYKRPILQFMLILGLGLSVVMCCVSIYCNPRISTTCKSGWMAQTDVLSSCNRCCKVVKDSVAGLSMCLCCRVAHNRSVVRLKYARVFQRVQLAVKNLLYLYCCFLYTSTDKLKLYLFVILFVNNIYCLLELCVLLLICITS